MKPIAVVTTVASREEAHQLARALVERKLAACAQISAIESVYTWKGEIQLWTDQSAAWRPVRQKQHNATRNSSLCLRIRIISRRS